MGVDASPVGSCGPPTQRPAPCTEWRIAGSDTIVSGSYPIPDSGVGEMDFYLSGFVPSGNGALVAWTTTYYRSNYTPTFWQTRALNIDGTPRSAIVSHQLMPVTGPGDTAFMGLAVTPQCAFGGLAYASTNAVSGCSFLPLDGDGNEIGPIVSLSSDGADGGVNNGTFCLDLGPAPGGFSYIQEAPNSGGTADLVTVGSNGSPGLRKSLGTFPGFNPGRLVLDDESFLLVTFFETDAANEYTSQVAHYDPSGVQIAPGTTVATSENFLMEETSRGVLAVYAGSDPANPSGQTLYAVPLSRDGVPTATPVSLAVTATPGEIYSFGLSPSPSGDVIIDWTTTTSSHFFATELDPGGGQRAPVLDFGLLGSNLGGTFLVSADGERALLVYAVATVSGGPSNGGVHTLPLACATD